MRLARSAVTRHGGHLLPGVSRQRPVGGSVSRGLAAGPSYGPIEDDHVAMPMGVGFSTFCSMAL